MNSLMDETLNNTNQSYPPPVFVILIGLTTLKNLQERTTSPATYRVKLLNRWLYWEVFVISINNHKMNLYVYETYLSKSQISAVSREGKCCDRFLWCIYDVVLEVFACEHRHTSIIQSFTCQRMILNLCTTQYSLIHQIMSIQGQKIHEWQNCLWEKQFLCLMVGVQ